MGRLTDRLVQSAYLYSTQTNEFNDSVYTVSTTAIPCLFRDISIVNRAANMEIVTFDGELWFDADAVIERGEVYLVGAEYLRIEKITVARSRLRSNDIEFIKCEVTRQRQLS